MLQIKKYCYHSYIEFCDSMVFGIDPRSRLKSELTLSEMRLVLVTSRSAIIFLADEATLPEWVIKPILNNCISRVRCQVSWELYT